MSHDITGVQLRQLGGMRKNAIELGRRAFRFRSRHAADAGSAQLIKRRRLMPVTRIDIEAKAPQHGIGAVIENQMNGNNCRRRTAARPSTARSSGLRRAADFGANSPMQYEDRRSSQKQNESDKVRRLGIAISPFSPSALPATVQKRATCPAQVQRRQRDAQLAGGDRREIAVHRQQDAAAEAMDTAQLLNAGADLDDCKLGCDEETVEQYQKQREQQQQG